MTAQRAYRLRAGISEKDFQEVVLHLARTLGYTLSYHVPDSRRTQAGFPDLVLVSERRGRVLFRELKTDVGRIRPEQKLWIAGLLAGGLDAGLWRPEDFRSGRIAAELQAESPLAIPTDRH